MVFGGGGVGLRWALQTSKMSLMCQVLCKEYCLVCFEQAELAEGLLCMLMRESCAALGPLLSQYW